MTGSGSDDSTSNSIKKTIETQIQNELASLDKKENLEKQQQQQQQQQTKIKVEGVVNAKKRKSDSSNAIEAVAKIESNLSNLIATSQAVTQSLSTVREENLIAKKKKNKKKKNKNKPSKNGAVTNSINSNVNQMEQERLEKQLIEQQKLQQEQIEQLQKQIDEIVDAESEENGILETALNENDFNKVYFFDIISIRKKFLIKISFKGSKRSV